MSRKISNTQALCTVLMPSLCFVIFYFVYVVLVAAVSYLGTFISLDSFTDCDVPFLSTYSSLFLSLQYIEFLGAVFVLFSLYYRLYLGLGCFLSLYQGKPKRTQEPSPVHRILLQICIISLASFQPTDIMINPSPIADMPVAPINSTHLGGKSSISDNATTPLLCIFFSLSTVEKTISMLCIDSFSSRTLTPLRRHC